MANVRRALRRAIRKQEIEHGGGELNIVPFLDIITNVLMFVLATVSVTFTATIDTFPPRAGGTGARAPTTPTLGLTVIVVPDGFSMKASGGNVAAGCNGAGPGLAIPKTAADYDYASLNACAKKLKGISPDFAGETAVTISANANIPYQVIIGTIDALRKADNGDDLFPDVNFGLAK